jgi:hypothetical protein
MVTLARHWPPPQQYQGPFFDERDDPVEYAIIGEQGQCVGECHVIYNYDWTSDYGYCPILCDMWVMSQVWIEPEFRRQGYLRRAWELLVKRYPGIQPDPPLSKEAWAFFATRPEVDMTKMFRKLIRKEWERQNPPCKLPEPPADWPG